jgi:hypothetical protein
MLRLYIATVMFFSQNLEVNFADIEVIVVDQVIGLKVYRTLG